jgi:hypothetical protein
VLQGQHRGQIWLAKWKTLKKRGQVNAVYGYYFVAGSTYPLHGTAVVRLDDKTVIGVVVHRILGTESDITMTMLLNPVNGVASGKYDTNGNGVGDVSRTWNPDSCKDADGT